MLTRSQFDTACKAFINKYSNSSQSPSNTGSKGWSWNEHASVPGMGYMSRTATVYYRKLHTCLSLDALEEEVALESFSDVAVADSSVARESLASCQYVVYSATFRVPTFYFIIHDLNGSPLPLNDLIQTSLFHSHALEGIGEATPFAISLLTSTFPFLSQGDHPTLATPCWYLHPCETAASVDEIMSEVQDGGHTEDMRLLRWLEAWFMVVGSVVDLSST